MLAKKIKKKKKGISKTIIFKCVPLFPAFGYALDVINMLQLFTLTYTNKVAAKKNTLFFL